MKLNNTLLALRRMACVTALAALLAGTATAQNISVTAATGQSAETFIRDQLVGSGVYIWNVQFNGSATISSPNIGTFLSNGYPGLYMDTGVVLTTGNVSVAVGPNNSGSSSSSAGSYSDGQLSSIASGSINNCGTIDFDFVSISPFVSVSYCFGSEEYPEYVCSSFNDVFAFYITGPHQQANGTWVNQTWNAACIPHTVDATNPNGIAVTINAVNQGMAGSSGGSGTGCNYNFSEFYVANHTPGAGGSPNQQPGVQYDGYTRKLSANATLQPCTQYHMHISVCNVSDNAYDSGVFLEKKSFTSPAADVSLSHREATKIHRSDVEVVPMTLNGSSYTFGYVQATFGGTAEAGVDYICRTDSNMVINNDNRNFYINDGDRYLTITPTPTADLTTPKTINIHLRTALCQGYPDLFTYDTLRYILVEDNILRLRDTIINAIDTCRSVGVEVAIGEAVQFHWMPEDDIDFPNQQYSSALITESRNYRVAAVDAEGHTDTAEVQVIVTPHGEDGIEAPHQDVFRIHPNPTNGLVNVYMHHPTESAGTLTLIDISGKQLESVSLPAGTIDLTLDLSAFPQGAYLLKLVTPDLIGVNKVIKQK